MIMMNRNLIFVVVSFAMMIMSCGQELTPNEESQDVALSSAGLRVSTDLLCSDERFWSGWEAVKDKIGVFLNSGTNTLLANQYLYAFSSTNSKPNFFKYAANSSPVR